MKKKIEKQLLIFRNFLRCNRSTNYSNRNKIRNTTQHTSCKKWSQTKFSGYGKWGRTMRPINWLQLFFLTICTNQNLSTYFEISGAACHNINFGSNNAEYAGCGINKFVPQRQKFTFVVVVLGLILNSRSLTPEALGCEYCNPTNVICLVKF